MRKLLVPIFSLIILSFLLVACPMKPTFYGAISGLEAGNWRSTLYLIDPGSWSDLAGSYRGTVIDSFRIDEDGQFSVKEYDLPEFEEEKVLLLAIQKNTETYANQLNHEQPEQRNYFPIIYKKGTTIDIQADANRFLGSFAMDNPSRQNEEILMLRDVLVQAFQDHLSEKENLGLLRKEKAELEFQMELFEFAEETPYVLPALTAIRWASIEAYYERVPEQLFAQAQKWKKEAPQHPWVQELVATADPEVLPVLQGSTIPDFDLPLSDGDTGTIHGLLGEKLTILDLWASWCGPCRKENRSVLGPLWESYEEEGLQIIGYALEAEEQTWFNAIEKDAAGRWPQSSHMQGDDAPLFEALRIRTIPANFILDQKGEVLAKNLHGAELIQFVEEYFSK